MSDHPEHAPKLRIHADAWAAIDWEIERLAHEDMPAWAHDVERTLRQNVRCESGDGWGDE